MGILGKITLFVLLLTKISFAAEYFVAFEGAFPGENIELPAGVELVKSLPNLELIMVKSFIDPEISGSKFIYRRTPFKSGKNSSVENTEQSMGLVDTEEGIAGMYPWGASAIEAPLVWEENIKGKGVKVLLLDSGVDVGHPALAGKITKMKDFTRTRVSLGVPYAEFDSSGHATHIAATIAGNGYKGLYGVAPEAELYIGKVCVFICENLDGMVEALEWGIDEGVQVVNMSFNSKRAEDWKDIGDHIFSRLEHFNIVAVAAVGNEGRTDAEVKFPATVDTVIAVGAVDIGKNKAEFSNWGEKLDIMAPGVDVVSASLMKGINSTPTLLSMKSGTSMAAPHVVGVVALMLSAGQELDASEIRAVIQETADQPVELYSEALYGAGLINARAAVERILGE